MQIINSNPGRNSIEIGAWIALAVGAGCLFGALVSPFFATKLQIFSQVGDFSGGIVGPIWSLAAVLFFIAALKVQKEQLAAQKRDLKAQAEMLKLQAEELKATREVFEAQKFESIFFNLLESHQSVLDNLGHSCAKDPIDAIHEELKDMFILHTMYSGRDAEESLLRIRNELIRMVKDVFKKDINVRSYTKSLIRLLTFVMNNKVKVDAHQDLFVVMLQSLTDYDLKLLEYYSLVSREGNIVFKHFNLGNRRSEALSFTEIDFAVLSADCDEYRKKDDFIIELNQL